MINIRAGETGSSNDGQVHGWRSVFLVSRNVVRSSFVWNTWNSIVTALLSVVMLIAVSQLIGVGENGVLDLATSIVVVFMTIGNYGMRRFQASDVSMAFSFSEYARSRAITSVLMLVTAAGFVVVALATGFFPAHTALVFALLIGLRLVDVVEDVIVGMTQQRNRLDIGTKISTLRLVVVICVFLITMLISHDLVLSLVLAIVGSLGVFLWLAPVMLRYLLEARDVPWRWSGVWQLLRMCFPLFLSACLTLLINNAPKFGITAELGNVAQGYYALLAMPVFVIQLLILVIFNPLIYRLSVLWRDGDFAAIIRRILAVSGLTVVITAALVPLARPVLLPLLTFIYGVDIRAFVPEFIWLIVAGGAVALGGFMSTIVTIQRRQNWLIAPQIGLTVVALSLSNYAVAHGGLMGACLLYLGLFVAQMAAFIVLVIMGFHKAPVTPAATARTGSAPLSA